MKNSFTFTRFAKKSFLRLDKSIQERIRSKLEELKQHQHIHSALKPLTDFASATHRLRVGDYRVILKRLPETDFLVIDIDHRSTVYR